jgi:hypothetical protein
MKQAPNFLPEKNGELSDYEITYADARVPFSSSATETHLVEKATSIKTALERFNRAVPRHGAIKSVRKIDNQKGGRRP